MTVDVSVVIAARNEELFVEEAVRSVLDQQGLTLELVFVDDASTDRTFEIVERLAGEYPNLRAMRNPEPGKVRAFNLGISKAEADWVCIFAGDDVMPAGSLKARYDSVADWPKDGAPLNGVCRLVTLSTDPKLDGQVIPRDPNKATFSGVCYLMNRAAKNTMWPIPEQLPNEDTWLELAAQYLGIPYRITPTIGCAWRIHAGNSINMLVPWPEFSRKFTSRMAANALFLAQYGDRLGPEARKVIEARVRCEEARKRGDLLGILLSGVKPLSILRAASLSGATAYRIRRRAYKLLSGW